MKKKIAKKNEEKKEGVNKSIPTNASKMRQIILETDGNNIRIVKADVAGSLEFIAILQSVIGQLSQQRK